MNTADDAAASPATMAPDVDDAPFHAGELRLQTLTGRREKLDAVGRAFIRPFMPDQHRDFFAQLPWMIVGGLDARRQPWATLWAGPPGFMHSPEPTTLRITRPHWCLGDPPAGTWHDGAPVGMLGIETHTRRRNRLNGTLRHVADGADAGHTWDVQVRQSFGNCPKYIQLRHLRWQPRDKAPGALQGDTDPARLPAAGREIVASADTFFIASASPAAGQPSQQRSDGVDVSHRGGAPGFVRIDTADATQDTLLIPDYTGNFMFNTLGNILLNPRVGLLFIGFGTGDVLWLAGHAQVDADSPRIAELPGAQRLLRVRVDQWKMSRAALPLRASAFTPAPGPDEAGASG